MQIRAVKAAGHEGNGVKVGFVTSEADPRTAPLAPPLPPAPGSAHREWMGAA